MFKQCLVLILCLHFVSSAPSRNSTNGDATPCLKEFYQVAYDGTYNCTNQFDFFSNNSTTSFISGKACFLEVAKEECSSSQYNLLSTKYQDFLDVITKKPKNESECDNFYYKYNSLKCEPMAYDLNIKDAQIQRRHLKINDSRVLDVIELCQRVQTCLKSQCFSPAENALISSLCESIKLWNSEFKACEFLIEKESPNLSEYKCLEGADFYRPSDSAKIMRYGEKKQCTKEIMKDICGEKAVKDFDKYADMTFEMFVKANAMKMAIGEIMTKNVTMEADSDGA